MKARPRFGRRRGAGTTLVEMIFAVAIGCTVLGALLTSLAYIFRNDAAVTAYSTAEGNQMRISDYIAFDVRRALSVNVTNDVLTITVPDYYNDGGVIPAAGTVPQDPVLVNGSVTYGTQPVTITYYQQGSNFYRTVNGAPTVIAGDVADFSVTAESAGHAISCTTTFSPSFTFNPSAGAIAATSVFTNVYPRNVSARP